MRAVAHAKVNLTLHVVRRRDDGYHDLVSVFLTGVDGLNKPDEVRPSEMIRLNMSIPPCTDTTGETRSTVRRGRGRWVA